jgi:hypothetical protein
MRKTTLLLRLILSGFAQIGANVNKSDEIVHQMEEIAFRNFPWIPITYQSSFVLLHPGPRNFRKSGIIRKYVKYLKLGN